MRAYHRDFWWNLARPRSNVSTEKDKQKETVVETEGIAFIMDVLGNNAEDRERDGDRVSGFKHRAQCSDHCIRILFGL